MSTLFLICFVGIGNVLSDVAIMIIKFPSAHNPEKLVFGFNSAYKLYIGFERFELYSQKTRTRKNFRNKNKFCTSVECNPPPQGVQKNLKNIQQRQGWSFPLHLEESSSPESAGGVPTAPAN